MVIALTGIKDIQEDSLTIQTLFISQFFSYTAFSCINHLGGLYEH